MSHPDYLHWFCKDILNVTLIPTQCVILKELSKRKFPMLIASRGFGKSFMLAVYSLVRAVLQPGLKVVIAGAAFRQSKIIFNYIEQIWDNAPLLRDMAKHSNKQYGAKHDQDMYRFLINGSEIMAIPIGNGDKIRGLRAGLLVCVSKDTYIQTNRGLVMIGDYLDGKDYKVMNGDGKFVVPKYLTITKPTDVYEVKLRYGFTLRGSASHRILTCNGWKRIDELTTDDYVLLDSNNYFPENYIMVNGRVVDENIAFLMGSLVSEGYVASRGNMTITNTDVSFLENIRDKSDFLNWTLRKRKAYTDSRGWNCKECYSLSVCDTEFRSWLAECGLDRDISYEKSVPWSILQSPKSVVLEFLRGAYIGDGSCFKAGNNIRVCYYTTSERLAQEIQLLLLKFNIITSRYPRGSKLSNRRQWMVVAQGQDGPLLYKMLNIDKWKVFDEFVNSINPRTPHVSIIKHGDKYRAETWYCNKSKYLGLFQTEEECIRAFDDFISSVRKYAKVRSVTKLDKKEVLYDFTIPDGHSFISNGMISHNCDEFASIPKDIFETVLSGFLAVRTDPIDSVIKEAARKKAKELGIKLNPEEFKQKSQNQLVISGTASYSFQHFYDYWRDWHDIICSRGDYRKLEEFFRRRSQDSGRDVEEIKEELNWKDYSIIRIPFELIPDGFMDEAQIARARATMHSGTFNCEYGCVFSSDSQGFFKRSLIESCVASEKNIDNIRSFNKEADVFHAVIVGDKDRQYIFGVDPASEVDNCSIVILEMWPNHRRVVYSWVTNSKQFKEEVKAGHTKEEDYYAYCARKIRDLMSRFPCARIMMDSQGGGKAIMEALHDSVRLKDGEIPIWPIIDINKPKDTDMKSGLHILELVNFASYEWTSEANHGLRKDFEEKKLLFPAFDAVILSNVSSLDKISGRSYDTLEDCLMDIEELKNELSTIVLTRTSSGRDRWDTPEVKIGNKKGRMRKDRYSALLMANMGARNFGKDGITYVDSVGGFADKTSQDKNSQLYVGNEQFNDWAMEFYGE